MAYAFISEQNKLAQPNLNYVWDPNTMSWVKEEQPIIDGGTLVVTGVATSANQTNGSQKTQIVDAGGEATTVTNGRLDVNIGALGQTTMSASIPVVVASDQTPILVIAI